MASVNDYRSPEELCLIEESGRSLQLPRYGGTGQIYGLAQSGERDVRTVLSAKRIEYNWSHAEGGMVSGMAIE
jgi:hypothetical protein